MCHPFKYLYPKVNKFPHIIWLANVQDNYVLMLNKAFFWVCFWIKRCWLHNWLLKYILNHIIFGPKVSLMIIRGSSLFLVSSIPIGFLSLHLSECICKDETLCLCAWPGLIYAIVLLSWFICVAIQCTKINNKPRTLLINGASMSMCNMIIVISLSYPIV